MSSQAQFDANRENSKLSTGPQSPEGKAASAQNSRTHGFSSPMVIVPPEMTALFDAFESRFFQEYQPGSDSEYFYFRRIVHAAWAIESIDSVEAASFDNFAAIFNDDDQERCYARLARYRAMHMRLFEQSRKSFAYEQTRRAIRDQAAKPAELPALAEAPPHANLSAIITFAKQSQIACRFPSYTREQVDDLDAMIIQTHHLNAENRKKKLDLEGTKDRAAA